MVSQTLIRSRGRAVIVRIIRVHCRDDMTRRKCMQKQNKIVSLSWVKISTKGNTDVLIPLQCSNNNNNVWLFYRLTSFVCLRYKRVSFIRQKKCPEDLVFSSVWTKIYVATLGYYKHWSYHNFFLFYVTRMSDQ